MNNVYRLNPDLIDELLVEIPKRSVGQKVCKELGEPSSFYDQFNSNGKVIYSKDINGDECWNNYDSDGRLIYSEYSSGDKYFMDYREGSQTLINIDSGGKIYWAQYNDRYELIQKGNRKPKSKECSFCNYNDERIIYFHYYDGHEEWFNDDGNKIKCRYPDGTEEFFDPDGTSDVRDVRNSPFFNHSPHIDIDDYEKYV